MISKGPNNMMIGRLMFLAIILGIIGFAAVASRLFYMQVIDYKFYQEKAVNQQTREVTITPTRGTIYDRNMKELAVSASTEMVTLEPVKISDGDHELIAKELSEILEMDYNEILEETQKEVSYLELKKGLEKNTADKIRLFVSEEGISGVYLHEDSTRYYPYGSFASHVIGFTGTDGDGLNGIERWYNETLTGTPGKVVTAQNAENTDMPYKYETYIPGENGSNIVLTIDEVIQHFLEKHLETALSDNEANLGVAGIVMDVKTGEILAMSTKPDFDLNEPFTITDPKLLASLEGLSGEEYSEARTNALYQMWRNKTINDTYEPGSTFKVFTVATAYEENLVESNYSFNCTGHSVVGPFEISCWKSGGHGLQTSLAATLQNSCNPAMINIASKLGSESFREYYEGFGFFEKTGIDLPGESTGLFFAEGAFNEVELATASFGQGMQVTPIQMLSMVSAVANDGYLVTPYLLKEVLDEDGNILETTEPTIKRQVISEETSDYMREALESVVSVGTGRNAYVAGYDVGGKTATSEKLPRGNEKYIASFIGVAPMDDPQIAVLVMIDEPVDGAIAGGGLAAAPVVGNIFADILPYMEIEPQYKEGELSLVDIITPNLMNKDIEEAKTLLDTQKISYRTIGDGTTVTGQIPDSGAVIPASSEIVLYLGAEKPEGFVTVPNLMQMTPSQVNNMVSNSEIYVKMTGAIADISGNQVQVVSQTPAAGTQISIGSVITVQFADTKNVGD